MHVLGPQSLKVKLNDGRHVRRHLNHVRSRQVTSETQPTVVLLPWMDQVPDISPPDSISTETNATPNETGTARVPEEDVRRSSRQRNPPIRYSPGHYKLRGEEI